MIWLFCFFLLGYYTDNLLGVISWSYELCFFTDITTISCRTILRKKNYTLRGCIHTDAYITKWMHIVLWLFYCYFTQQTNNTVAGAGEVKARRKGKVLRLAALFNGILGTHTSFLLCSPEPWKGLFAFFHSSYKAISLLFIIIISHNKQLLFLLLFTDVCPCIFTSLLCTLFLITKLPHYHYHHY